ncbi:MAG: hypothetical protein RR228_01980 [Bacilli bacterium]
MFNEISEDTKRTFEFLVDNYDVLQDDSFYWWCAKEGYEKNFNSRGVDISNLILSRVPLDTNEFYKKANALIHEENSPYKKEERNCSDLVKHYEIENILEKWINDAIEKADRETSSEKRQELYNIINDYIVLYNNYVTDYNLLSDSDLIDLIQKGYNVIYKLDNPSKEVEKACVLFELTHKHNKGFRYADEKYEKCLRQRGIVDPYDEKIDDELLKEIIKSSPVCSVSILEKDVSRDVVNTALDEMPEVLFYFNWSKLMHHLLLNDRVYDIIEKKVVIKDDENRRKVADILETNLGLLCKRRFTEGMYDDDKEFIRVSNLLSWICYNYNNKDQENYINDLNNRRKSKYLHLSK